MRIRREVAWLYLAVGMGSALGAVCRLSVGMMVAGLVASPFPWATLLVNVLGSWLIARFATHAGLSGSRRLARLHPWAVAGFCGGFTTFSLFSLEVAELVIAGRPGLALAYLTVSVPLWLGAAWAGDARARSVLARRTAAVGSKRGED